LPTRNQAVAALVAIPLFLVSGCSTVIDQELSQTTRLADPLLPVQEDTATPSPAETSSPAVKSPEEVTQELSVEPDSPRSEEKVEPESSSSTQLSSPAKEEVAETIPTESEPPAEEPEEIKISVANLAYASFRTQIDGSFTVEDSQVLVGPSMSSSQENSLEKALSDAVSIWDHRIGIIDNYHAVLFTVNDLEWADQMMATYGGRLPTGETWVSYIGNGPWGSDCGPGDAQPKVFYLCVSTKTDDRTIRWQKESIVQKYFQSLQSSIGLTPSNNPLWISGGSAKYFGYTVANPGSSMVAGSKGVATRLMATEYGFGLANAINNMSESDLVGIYTLLEVGSTSQSRHLINDYAAYDLGGLAVEYLIGTSSYETFIGFMSDMGRGISWKTAFSNRFGYTTDEFYKNMYSYLNSVY